MTETQPTETITQQDFLLQLRSATAPMHSKLEQTALSENLLKENVSGDDYAAYLLHMREAIAFCEEQVFPVTAILFNDIDTRRKLQLIDNDLNCIKEGNSDRTIKPYHAVIPNGDLAFALGYMYVIEGSTLGGRILLNHISKTLGYSAQNGASFFAGYGAETGKMWKDFLSVLCNYAVSSGAAQQIIEGSKYAFTSLEQYMA